MIIESIGSDESNLRISWLLVVVAFWELEAEMIVARLGYRTLIPNVPTVKECCLG